MNLLNPALYTPSSWLVVLAAGLVVVFGVGRLTRVIVHDHFPPAERFRMWWTAFTQNGPWALLFTCFWCLPFWIVLVCLGWFALGLFVWWVALVWWIFWGALALAYLVSIVIARDEPESGE